MMSPAIMTATALAFLAGPVQQPDGEQTKCLYPGDCLRHAYGNTYALSFGECASRSAWREQYVHATPDERRGMRKTRHQTMDDRIMRAYQLIEPQEKIVQGIIDEFYAAHNEAMGATFSEHVNLRRKRRARYREIEEEFQRRKRGEDSAPSKMPRWRDDPVLLSTRERLQQIEHDYPIPWLALLDKIDKVLPKEQAERGRERLAEQYPTGFSADGNQKITSTKQENVGDETALARLRAAFEKFVARHELSGGQANAAESVLRELGELAVRMTRTMQAEIARYPADEDANSRRLVAEAFQFDINELYDEFQHRLDALLTTAQLDKSRSARILDSENHKRNSVATSGFSQ